MIIVTGANGHLGAAVVRHLLDLVPADRLGVSVRDPGKAHHLAERGVRVRQGDFDRPETLAAAFEGAERLVLVSTDSMEGGRRVAQHRAAIDAARAAGVAHVYYTSVVEQPAAPRFVVAAHHVETEALLRASGLASTFLRNGLYAEVLPSILAPALATGELAAPADGPTAWVARDDLAEATARLVAAGSHPNEAVALTGPEALDLAQVAAIAATITGRPIARRTVSEDAHVAGAVAAGVPEALARAFASIFAATAAGEFAAVDPALERILGRRPRAVGEVLRPLLAAPAAVAGP